VKITYIDPTSGWHTIDKLWLGLKDLGNSVIREPTFDRDSAARSDLVWVDFLTHNAADVSHKNMRAKLVLRVSAMELYRKDCIAGIDWNNVDALVVQGKHQKEFFIEKYNRLPKEKIHVIPTATDIDKYPLRKGGRTNRVFINSQIHWRKGIQLIPEILDTFPDDWHFFHVGNIVNRDCMNYIDYELRRRGIKNRYHYLGTTGNIPGTVKDMAYYLHTSYTEGLPRTVGECMSMGMQPMIRRYRGVGYWPEEYVWSDVSEVYEHTKRKWEPEKHRNWIIENKTIEKVARMANELCLKLVAQK